jgi:hypothetical protein
MQMLSIVNTVFLPLTFLAGAWGLSGGVWVWLGCGCDWVWVWVWLGCGCGCGWGWRVRFPLANRFPAETQTRPAISPAACALARPHQRRPRAGVFGTNFTSVTAYNWDQGFWFFWVLCLGVTLSFVLVLRHWGMFRS